MQFLTTNLVPRTLTGKLFSEIPCVVRNRRVMNNKLACCDPWIRLEVLHCTVFSLMI
jgi:hypothetical protein